MDSLWRPFLGTEMLILVDDKGHEHNWWVNQKNVAPDLTVKKLQADGDELMMILAKIQNIPLAPYNRVVVWSGDIAQFIYDNALPQI